jgi:recombination protein RecT
MENQAITTPKQRAISSRPSTADQVTSMLKAQWKAMQAVVPKHVTAERLARVGISAITRTPGLAKCDPATIVEGIMAAASLGLECNDGTGRAYLIPYGARAQLIVGYQGLLELAYRSGMVDRIVARAVFEGDEFSYSYGLHETLTHVPSDETDPSKLTHVYAVVSLKDCKDPLFEVMTRAQIENVRKGSKAGRADSPWATSYVEMSRKTVLRRICKIVPRSVELVRAANEDEERDLGPFGTKVEQVAPAVEQLKSFVPATHIAPVMPVDDPGPPTREEVSARQRAETSEPVYALDGEEEREPGADEDEPAEVER